MPDISLYDHSRTAAGIAACLSDYHSPDTGNDHAIRDRTAEKFRLLAGDLSGIQRALFAFAPGRSKGVAKTLRARSFLLSLVSEAALELALSRLEAHPTQVFMNAGGRFLVLLPNVPRLVPALHDVRHVVEQWCCARFGGRLTLNLDWNVTLCGNDFYGKRFRAILETVRERLEQAKKRKLSAVLMENGRWNDGGAFVLSERYAWYRYEGTCESCGQAGRRRHAGRRRLSVSQTDRAQASR